MVGSIGKISARSYDQIDEVIRDVTLGLHPKINE